jgi:prephenate dehydrogenase
LEQSLVRQYNKHIEFKLKQQHFMQIDTLAIIGVGLLGGSIALAARASNATRSILGVSRNSETLAVAQSRGMFDETSQDLTVVSKANLAIICTPISQIARLAREILALSPHAIVSDVGSSKKEIVESVESETGGPCRFIGGHPLAGSEKTGVAHARANLFDKKIVFLTPTKKTDKRAKKLLTYFWEKLSASIVEMSAQEHDQIMAQTSHAPHLIAYALAGTVSSEYLRFAGAGLRDSIRLAGSDPRLWLEIALSNRDNILQALHQVQSRTQMLEQALEAGDEATLLRLFSEGRKVHHALGS